jgi:hypothetical protein
MHKGGAAVFAALGGTVPPGLLLGERAKGMHLTDCLTKPHRRGPTLA